MVKTKTTLMVSRKRVGLPRVKSFAERPEVLLGHVRLSVNGTVVLPSGTSEVVDEFWGMIVDEVDSLFSRRSVQFSLPTQPVEVVLSMRRNRGVDATFTWGFTVREVRVTLTPADAAGLLAAGEAALQELSRITGDNQEWYEARIGQARLARHAFLLSAHPQAPTAA